MTLNGIAQGWITDRIVDLMRAAGVTSSLVDMGEIRALGDNGGCSWNVAIAGTDTVLPLVDQAVATSSPDGFHFDAASRFGHIIDPQTGATPHRYARVTVTAPAAATADALSTGLMLLDPASVRGGLQPDVTADVDEVALDLPHQGFRGPDPSGERPQDLASGLETPDGATVQAR